MLPKRWQIGIYLIFFTILMIGCIYTQSRDPGLDRIISIKVTSGNVSMNLSGHISENIYSAVESDLEKQNFPNEKTPIVSQGRATIQQNIILYETQEFNYALTYAEVLMVNIRSVDDNNAQLMVIEYGKAREYKIDGKNKFGQVISFRN
jgi:hypothetical protein